MAFCCYDFALLFAVSVAASLFVGVRFRYFDQSKLELLDLFCQHQVDRWNPCLGYQRPYE